MNLKTNLKDWEIAREMFGKNTKHECHLVKILRKNKYWLSELCEGYYLLTTEDDEIGWLVPENIVE